MSPDPDFEALKDELNLGLTHSYLEAMDLSILGKTDVTLEDARAYLKRIREIELFEKTMMQFISFVAVKLHKSMDQPGKYEVFMRTDHKDWIRAFHQRHQKLEIYRGGREPKLLGLPLWILDDAKVPMLVKRKDWVAS